MCSCTVAIEQAQCLGGGRPPAGASRRRHSHATTHKQAAQKRSPSHPHARAAMPLLIQLASVLERQSAGLRAALSQPLPRYSPEFNTSSEDGSTNARSSRAATPLTAACHPAAPPPAETSLPPSLPPFCSPNDLALAGAFAVVFGVQRLVPTFKPDWYKALRKPSWTPPNYVFPLVSRAGRAGARPEQALVGWARQAGVGRHSSCRHRHSGGVWPLAQTHRSGDTSPTSSWLSRCGSRSRSCSPSRSGWSGAAAAPPRSSFCRWRSSARTCCWEIGGTSSSLASTRWRRAPAGWAPSGGWEPGVDGIVLLQWMDDGVPFRFSLSGLPLPPHPCCPVLLQVLHRGQHRGVLAGQPPGSAAVRPHSGVGHHRRQAQLGHCAAQQRQRRQEAEVRRAGCSAVNECRARGDEALPHVPSGCLCGVFVCIASLRCVSGEQAGDEAGTDRGAVRAHKAWNRRRRRKEKAEGADVQGGVREWRRCRPLATAPL